MGYPRALNFTINSKFGQVQPKFSYIQLKCFGNETALSECEQSNEVVDCGPNDGAGVVCDNAGGKPFIFRYFGTPY